MRGLALLSTPPSAPRACVPLSIESGSWQEWSLQDVGLFDAAIFAAAVAGIFALTARGGTSAQPSASYARDPMELDGVALPFISPRRQQLRFSVLSKMIVDTIDGAQRPGGGGVQGFYQPIHGFPPGMQAFAPQGAHLQSFMQVRRPALHP